MLVIVGSLVFQYTGVLITVILCFSWDLDLVVLVNSLLTLSVEICLVVFSLSEGVTDVKDATVKCISLVGSSSVCVSTV